MVRGEPSHLLAYPPPGPGPPQLPATTSALLPPRSLARPPTPTLTLILTFALTQPCCGRNLLPTHPRSTHAWSRRSKNINELVSTHGYSQNQIVVWRYSSMSKVATLTGHTLRVLYLAMSPDGQTIVTGAGDETLRFWNVFPGPKTKGDASDSSSMLDFQGRTAIR